ncbi:hypothetical protein [Cryptosporangium sp. NPDC051539]|uniref:hypothetical protein n=1 Tax=Cryptosporangium sp. NPDC051539 TaxID=3363962 RepID=UPI0037A78254
MGSNNVESDLARDAFIAAHGRFQHDHQRLEAARIYASFGETLWWIFALDEHYRHGRSDPKDYEQHRNEDPHGRVVAGLRLARNRVGHQLTQMLEHPMERLAEEQRLSDPFAHFAQLVFRPFEHLPDPDRGFERENQVKAYKTFLVGRPARYVLRDANYFFVRQRDKIDVFLGAG